MGSFASPNARGAERGPDLGALPRGFIFIACFSLGLGENAVKTTDADSLWRLGLSDGGSCPLTLLCH
ncbi:hypothetical protein U1Q18_026427 [Sarracenia purpurea var. burkii]